MRFTLSTNYVVPAVLLNPIFFLHSLNALLARILPPIAIDAALQPPSYYPLGPSAEHPHVNMHANDNLCWSYTLVMVFAQLVAFGRVSRKREEMRERDAQKKLNAIAGGGIIRRFSDREIPLEREAYSSTDEDTDAPQIDPITQNDQKSGTLTNGPTKAGPNGHVFTPRPEQMVT